MIETDGQSESGNSVHTAWWWWWWLWITWLDNDDDDYVLYELLLEIMSWSSLYICFLFFHCLPWPSSRVLANGLGDLGSIPHHVIPKWYLIPPGFTLSDIRYVSRVKWSDPGKGVAPSHTPWCSSYWKRSLLVALDYGHQLYLLSCFIPTQIRIFFQLKNAIEWISQDQLLWQR